MPFIRFLATASVVTVLGATVTATVPAQAASGAGLETQGVSLRLTSIPERPDVVYATGGVTKSLVLWSWGMWDDGRTTTVTGFRIEARRNDGVYRTVKTVTGAKTHKTTVRNLRKGNYRFRVRALNGSTVGPAEVAGLTVRVRSHRLPKRYYTFRSKKNSANYTLLRVMSDRTVHGIADLRWSRNHNEIFRFKLVGRLSKAGIEGGRYYEGGPLKWRQTTQGSWKNLRLKGYTRIKKSRTLSGHKYRDEFKSNLRYKWVFPRH